MKKIKAVLIIFFSMMFFLASFVGINAEAAESNDDNRKAEHGIPVLYFDIDESKGTIQAMNSSPDHSAECYGSVSIKVPQGYTSEYTDEEIKDMDDLKLEYVRGRGTSSWFIPDKKPYKVKLDKGVDLFGMGKNKHWVLLANALDSTNLRNKVTYWIGQEMGMDYVSKSIPVEVVMNGEYYGLYYLTEQVRVGKTRVNIDELKEKDDSQDKISGGYLLAMDPDNQSVTDEMFTTTRDVKFEYDTPDFLEYSNDVQRNYICNYLQKTENAIFGQDFKDENGVSYKDYMDLQSAVDYWLIQQFTRNGDGFRTSSTYLYKKRDGKLYWGPIWDFDVSTYGDLSQEFADTEGFNPSMVWFERMKKDEDFVSLVKERWNLMYEKLLELTATDGPIDVHYNAIKVAEKYNAEKWSSDAGTGTFAGDVEVLKLWIDKRREWINNNLDKAFDLFPIYEYQWIDGQWYDINGSDYYQAKGSWKQNDKGWWFEDSSGWYAKNGWYKIDFTWYYFDQNGYMVSDSWKDGYYLSKDGGLKDFAKGQWKKNDTGWYYEDSLNWYPVDCWQKIDESWYYFNSNGYWEE
ncbi:MAG: CotH kinase family protein [Eubacterium sp.]|nr:CotH kinase family protein [Eubacterium sp.]